jgi:hypothetical protein
VPPQNRHFVNSNDDRSIRQLLKPLAVLKPQFIVLATYGGYEFLVTAALAETQLPVALVNSQALRKFAGATGLMGTRYEALRQER